MKKQSLVIKEVSNRQHQTQGRPNHTHNPPNNFPQHQTHQKGGCTWLFKEQLRIYMTFGQKSACIRGFWPKTCVYTWLLAKNPCMYATFGQKPKYTEKTLLKIKPRVKPIKGSVVGRGFGKRVAQHRGSCTSSHSTAQGQISAMGGKIIVLNILYIIWPSLSQ